MLSGYTPIECKNIIEYKKKIHNIYADFKDKIFWRISFNNKSCLISLLSTIPSERPFPVYILGK